MQNEFLLNYILILRLKALPQSRKSLLDTVSTVTR